MGRSLVRVLLLATTATPLIYVPQLIFPFVLGKAFFYRSVIELAVILAAGLFVFEYLRCLTDKPGSLWRLLRARVVFFRDPLFLALAAVVLIAAFSVALAPNAYRGFFGGGERGEGFLGVFHYLLFLALALVFFRVRDWVVFAGIWLGVAFVTMFYAWLQFFGVTRFPFALAFDAQPGSWTGNPAYLSGYLIISLAFVPFLWDRASGRLWRPLLVAFSAASLATVFVTGIRGAVLGLFAGVLALALGFLFQRGTRRGFRAIALGSLAGLVAFGGIFWMTRGAEVWQTFPGIGRLAKADLLATPSAATRLLALEVSWEAFKERPLFGWGLENYNIAYNKHYDPRYSFYAEDWFDRAHNRFVDTAVTQGTLGLLAYLAALGIMFRRFWEGTTPAFLLAIFSAYIVQNLFIFDQINTYIAFFALAGTLIAAAGEAKATENDIPAAPLSCLPKLALCVALGLGAVASGYALYAWNFVPFRQALRFYAALSTKNAEKILGASDSFLAPYTFLQAELRPRFLEVLYNSNLITDKRFAPLVAKALSAMEELVEREPYEPRNYGVLIESNNELAKKDDPAFYAKSEEFARKAVALTPKRQGMRYYLSFALAGQEKYEEALALAKETLALDDRIAKAHYQVGLVYGLMADSPRFKGSAEGELYRLEAEKEMDAALALARTRIGTLEEYTGTNLSSTQFYLFLESDLKNMAIFYRAWQRPEQIAKVLEALIFFNPRDADYVNDAIVVYRGLRDAEGIVRNALKLKALKPALAGDLDLIIDLARAGDWKTLDSF